jgi:hypothetical protein
MENIRRGMEYASRCGVDDRSSDNVCNDDDDIPMPVHNSDRTIPARSGHP